MRWNTAVIVLACGQQQRAMRSLYHPFPCWGGEENGKKKRQNLLGQDKGSLTEQQTKQTVTTTILIRRMYKTKLQNAQSNSHRLTPSVLLCHDSLPPHPAPPTRNTA